MKSRNWSRWSGAIWLLAGLAAIGITVAFRDDRLQWIVTIAGGIMAAVLGFVLVWRPALRATPWSAAVGVAWLFIYAGLTFQQRAEPAAWITDVFVGALGVAGALAQLRAR